MSRRTGLRLTLATIVLASVGAQGQSPIVLWQDCPSYHTVNRGPVMSPDRKWLAVGNQYEVAVRNADTLKYAFYLNPSDDMLWIAMTPDSKSLVVGLDVFGVDRAKVYDLATGLQTSEFLIPEGTVDAVRGYIAPGGYPALVYRTEKFVQVVGFNGAGWNTLGTFTGFTNIDDIAVSPNGKLLAVGDSGSDLVSIYSLETFSPNPVTPTKAATNPYALAFSPDSSKLAAGHSSGLVKFWNTSGWASPGEFTLPGTNPFEIEFTSDGTSLWIGYANSVEKRSLIGLLLVPTVTSDSTPSSMVLNRFDRPLFDGLADLRFVDSSFTLRLGPGHVSSITSLAVAPNNGWLVTGADVDDPVVRQWNATGGTEFRTRQPDNSGIDQLAVTNDSQKYVVCTSSNTETIRVYSATGTYLNNLVPISQANDVQALALSPAIAGVGYMAACSDGTAVRLIKLSDFTTLQTLPHTSAVSALAFNRDGSRLAAGHNDGTVRVYKPQAGVWVLVKSVAVNATASKLEFDPSGNYILVGTNDGTMGLQRLVKSTVGGETWAVNDTFELPGSQSVRTLSISRDGRTVAVSTYDFVHFFYLPTMQILSTWTSGGGALNALQYGATNETIYLASSNWLRCVKNPYPAFVSTVSVSPPSVPKGASATLTVHLTSKAPAGGLVVTLTDYTTSINTPATVAIPAGATSGSTTLTTSAGSTAGTYTITARLFGKGANGTLTIMP